MSTKNSITYWSYGRRLGESQSYIQNNCINMQFICNFMRVVALYKVKIVSGDSADERQSKFACKSIHQANWQAEK
jgi:hypothetical protein|tara:strand:+ start:1648 stop:1872 length:225 start_codon:yes stop_codon:yes gene_type:complete